MPSEHANKTEPLGPIAGLMVLWLHGPLHGQCRRDMGRCFLFQESHEVPQSGGRVAQLESQAAAESNVILNGVSQGFHRPPPGHGRAMERSETRSTLA